MKICHFNAIPVALLAISTVSCVDDKYDLTDIDTTSRLAVNNLVLPLNIDEIKLSSIIDIDTDDPDADIKIIDGHYAYSQDGDFNSGSISIPAVTIKSASIAPIVIPLELPFNTGVVLPSLPAFTLALPDYVTGYSFSSNNITEDICGLSHVGGEFDVKISMEISGMENLAESFSISDLQLQLPVGLSFSALDKGTFDQQTGILTVSTDLTGSKLEINGKASGLSLPDGAFDELNHSVSLSGETGMLGGNITVNPKSGGSANQFVITLNFKFGDIQVKSIDGIIKYHLDNISVPDIDISNLPDVLSQPGTDLILSNPQLYLTINNPLSESGVYAQTGFNVTAYHGDNSQLYSIDNPYMTISADPINHLVLSPIATSDYEGVRYTHVPFASLSRVLSGDGIPDKLKVELTDPNLPRQPITNFLIDHNFGEIHGSYTFVAPLQFESGTQIVYNDIVDGWSSDDLDAVTIQKLEVTFNATTTVPIQVNLTGYPLGKDGKRISGVNISPVTLDANANDQQVKITVDGVINNLDGIEFEAKASVASEAKALSPDMTITLKNVRPCVSGYYEKEL